MSEHKDWVGDSNSIYKTLGASNHTEKERETNDFYATDPIAIDKLIKKFSIPHNVWECACGNGTLVKRLKDLGHFVFASDIIDRGCSDKLIDFLTINKVPEELGNDFCILTNPPYSAGCEFVTKSLDLLDNGQFVIMFLKLQFLEGKKRFNEIYSKNPPRYLFVSTERILCAKNARFDEMKAGGGSAVAYGWYVWQKGYQGKTEIDWI